MSRAATSLRAYGCKGLTGPQIPGRSQMRIARGRKVIAVLGMLALAAFVASPASATTFFYNEIGGFEFTTDTSTFGAQVGIHFNNATGYVVNGHNTYGDIGWGNGFGGPSDTNPIAAGQSALHLTTV